MDVERSPWKRQLKISDDFRITKRIVKEEKKETHQDEKRENVRRPEADLTEPSLHDQPDLTDPLLQTLKQFDLNSKYGPCLGISRISRWERAEEFNLDPPKNVYEILVQNQNNPKYTECLWKDEVGLVPC